MKRSLRLIEKSPSFIWQILVSLIRANDSEIASLLRRRIYRVSCEIDTNVFITNLDNFSTGHESSLYHSCYILNNNGKFVLGNRSHLGAFCYVNVCYGSVLIGDDVAIGPGSRIIAYSNHYSKGRKVTDERIVGDIVVGNNVFIGANCTVLPGTIIQDNVIVAAGAVVRGKLESNSIYGGIPCKKLKAGWYA